MSCATGEGRRGWVLKFASASPERAPNCAMCGELLPTDFPRKKRPYRLLLLIDPRAKATLGECACCQGEELSSRNITGDEDDLSEGSNFEEPKDVSPGLHLRSIAAEEEYEAKAPAKGGRRSKKASAIGGACTVRRRRSRRQRTKRRDRARAKQSREPRAEERVARDMAREANQPPKCDGSASRAVVTPARNRRADVRPGQAPSWTRVERMRRRRKQVSEKNVSKEADKNKAKTDNITEGKVGIENESNGFNEADYVLSAEELGVEEGSMYDRLLEILDGDDITPEDFDLLLQLDTHNKKVTLEQSEISKFELLVVADADSADGEQRTSQVSREKFGDGSCQICLEPFKSLKVGAELRRLPCKHMFCRACIDAWLSDNSIKCPNLSCYWAPAADERESKEPKHQT